MARRQAAALSVAGGLLLLVTAAALAVTGDLTQPAGTAGCISETGAGPCTDGHGLIEPREVAVSPDGKSVYVASWDLNLGDGDGAALVRLNRDTTTGAISQPAGAAGCISETGSGGCAEGHALGRVWSVAVSPDGTSVYVATGGGVARFNRNATTGAISQPAGAAGCISEDGTGPCADGHALAGAHSVTVSPDGKSVYVSSFTGPVNAVARLNRSTTTGAISQPAGAAGCVSETGAGPCADGHGLGVPTGLAVSPDGKSVYVASRGNDAVARFNRNTTTGAISQPAGAAGCVSDEGAGPCANGHGLEQPLSVAVSPNGKTVYAAAFVNDAVVRFERNTTTGAIFQPNDLPGCVSESGAGNCFNGHGLDGAASVAVSPDGMTVYAAAFDSDAVARLNRNATTGAITQPAGTSGCVSETGAGTCADGHGLLPTPSSVAVSPDNKSVYVASGLAVVRFNRAP
ncbi:MAG TPA: beta-propeller fold lactonase family protein [Solirubrobacterales bacterium]|nr:beta-propeller fold lactonase family protein [Solirubrobacterales bacterium]